MPEITPSRFLVQAGWADAPHLTETAKEEMRRSGLPHLKEAREFGKPSFSAGAIFPIPESEIVVKPFALPRHFPRAYGLDVGWNKTAAIWGAKDQESGTYYLYTEHYRGQAEPSIHAAAIRARGLWVPGVIDPSARGRQPRDGKQLIADYRNLGLNIIEADHSVEAGLLAVLDLLSTGRLKVFETCTNWLAEYRLYRRDEKGRIVKEFDHLMDATRYLIVSGFARAVVAPPSAMSAVAPASAGDTRAGY